MTIEMSSFELCMRELTVRGSHWSPYSFIRTLGLMNKLKTDPLITHLFPFSEIGEALEVQRSRKGIKILLTPDSYEVLD